MSDPVEVGPGIYRSLEEVRSTGRFNMANVRAVVGELHHRAHGAEEDPDADEDRWYAAADWIEDDRERYMRGVMNGIEPSDAAEE